MPRWLRMRFFGSKLAEMESDQDDRVGLSFRGIRMTFDVVDNHANGPRCH